MSKFTQGRSGNPSGRKRGSTNKVTRAMREAMLAVYQQLGGEGALLSWAKASNGEFFKILLTKVMPPGVPVRLRGLTGTPVDQARKIVAAMARGAITPEEASTIMQVLTAQTRIVESDELSRRIAALEENLHGNPPSAT